MESIFRNYIKRKGKYQELDLMKRKLSGTDLMKSKLSGSRFNEN